MMSYWRINKMKDKRVIFYDKIKHMIYVAVDKSSKDEANWKVHHCKLIHETDARYQNFYNQCATDILTIFKHF